MIHFLHDLLFKNLVLKLVSFALAAFLYFTITVVAIHQDSPTLESLNLHLDRQAVPRVPVLVLSSAADVHDFKVDPQFVTVTVQGDAKKLAALQSNEIHAWVDLSGIEASGTLRKRIEVSTPAGVTFVQVSPPDVRVIFPRRS